MPERVFVWNEAQRREAVELHGMPAERVVATGAQQLDKWFGRRPSLPREDVRPEDRPRPVPSVRGVPLLEPVRDQPRRGGRGALRDDLDRGAARKRRRAPPGIGVVVRPHPVGAHWKSADLDRFGNAVVWPRKSLRPFVEAAVADFYDTLAHSAAVVGINTTAMIEAAIVGKSVLTVLAPEFVQEGTLHFHYLLEENGGFLHVASSLEEHVAQLAAGAGRARGGRGAAPRVRGVVRPTARPRPARHRGLCRRGRGAGRPSGRRPRPRTGSPQVRGSRVAAGLSRAHARRPREAGLRLRHRLEATRRRLRLGSPAPVRKRQSMRRGRLAWLALAGLLAGCGHGSVGERSTRPATTSARSGDDVVAHADRRRPVPAPAPRGQRVVVTVSTETRDAGSSGAAVRIGARAGRANPRGDAEVLLRRRAPLVVYVRASGYSDRSVRMPFQRRRRVVVRVYRRDLQWPLYGATLARTQAQPGIRLRPPFRIVWSRGLGALIEFPAVVSDGVAYIGNNLGTVRALSMRDGAVVWRYDTPDGKMASSPAVVGRDLVVHGMDGYVRVLDRATGRLRFSHGVGSPIESSPLVRDGIDYFGAWNGNVYALDLRTRRLRWVYRSGYKITSSAALAGGTLYIGDYGGRLLALAPGTGRLRLVGRR